MSKICSGCNKDKEETLFNKNRAKKDGLQIFCRDCQNVKSASYYSRNKEKHLALVRKHNAKYLQQARDLIVCHLRHNPCTDCSETDIVVLDFDHVRGKKVTSISNMIRSRRSLISIEMEIAKCEVRCANCHRRKTAKDFNWYKLTG